MKGWTRIMPSSITKYEIHEVAKDVIVLLKRNYTDEEIHFILRKAIGINEGTEPYFEEDE